MFKRIAENQARRLAGQYPVVTITGPRQSGKTTLAQQCFADKPYVNLESPQTRAEFDGDPVSFIEKYAQGAIFDEVQRCPELLSYIQVEVDKSQQVGQFILTGSHQFSLQYALTQSLAGRTAIIKLLPLSLEEIDPSTRLSVDEYLFTGFYPRIYQSKLMPATAYDNYIATYVERDLKQLIQIKDLSSFQRFLKLCASRVGSVLNMNSLSVDTGVSVPTIKHWLAVLEASYLITLLPPYFENFGKRVIKSPKLYFNDVGLACHLLDINELKQVERDPLRGALFENMIVMEAFKACYNRGLTASLYYYRDKTEREIDLIYKQGNTLTPIEIKASQSHDDRFKKHLDFFQELTKDRVEKKYVIYAGKAITQKDTLFLPFNETHTIIAP
ncbi:MAG: AAA family ATPase [Gammaproteobacteria bacterium CG11_big_fil_rev_8_21_14_0_20_46_22]|nr:MAG: AAA family ATPase [Gammaproteobacteria bacterium CG12_big_fil_rev_8_21_14_0_65_46_12]PIR11502.1 MAG: AAA family ATPase [Gammaproteobacteria bacterium CG11_big_fil_rev_8_21_14_0_20_46_22]